METMREFVVVLIERLARVVGGIRAFFFDMLKHSLLSTYRVILHSSQAQLEVPVFKYLTT